MNKLSLTIIFSLSGIIGLVIVGNKPIILAQHLQKAVFIQPKVLKGIQKGLQYLAKNQSTIDGSISKKYQLASASLAGLAFLAYPKSGYKRGPYGENIALILRYILSFTKDSNGKIKSIPGLGIWIHDGENQGRMHAHCYATLFLAEVYGTLRSDRQEKQVKRVLKGAIELLVKSQTYGITIKQGKRMEWGGWGYSHKFEPTTLADEASVTICVLQALRAARNCGIQVPSETIYRAINYIKLSMKKDGSVRYSLARKIKRSSYEITAAAVSTLNSAGVYKSYELARGLIFLRKAMDEEKKAGGTVDEAASNWYFYGNFYAAQAMYQSGDIFWHPWYLEASQSLLKKQQAEGFWANKRFGSPYATSMALLILQIPFENLPIFQR